MEIIEGQARVKSSMGFARVFGVAATVVFTGDNKERAFTKSLRAICYSIAVLPTKTFKLPWFGRMLLS